MGVMGWDVRMGLLLLFLLLSSVVGGRANRPENFPVGSKLRGSFSCNDDAGQQVWDGGDMGCASNFLATSQLFSVFVQGMAGGVVGLPLDFSPAGTLARGGMKRPHRSCESRPMIDGLHIRTAIGP
jgi:hypothetical protein